MTSDKTQLQKEQKGSGQNGVIFCAYIVKDGQRIYPRRAKCFCIRIAR